MTERRAGTRRLRARAGAVPGAFVAETVIDAPFGQVWVVAADLEHELPAYLPNIRAFTITRRDGERRRVAGRSTDQLEPDRQRRRHRAQLSRP